MPFFSAKSIAVLDTLDDRLQMVFRSAIRHFDFKLTEGHRDEAAQAAAFAAKRTKVEWPYSKHNAFPSKAAHALPYPWGLPLDSEDPEVQQAIRERLTLLAGKVIGVGHMVGVTLRWGGDWDSDGDTLDNNFDDLMHFELVED